LLSSFSAWVVLLRRFYYSKEVLMSKLYKKLVFIIVVAITLAALLLPGPRLADRLAAPSAPRPQAVQVALGEAPFFLTPVDFPVESGYTWAG
jgi:hypothetical protein